MKFEQFGYLLFIDFELHLLYVNLVQIRSNIAGLFYSSFGVLWQLGAGLFHSSATDCF